MKPARSRTTPFVRGTAVLKKGSRRLTLRHHDANERFESRGVDIFAGHQHRSRRPGDTLWLSQFYDTVVTGHIPYECSLQDPLEHYRVYQGSADALREDGWAGGYQNGKLLVWSMGETLLQDAAGKVAILARGIPLQYPNAAGRGAYRHQPANSGNSGGHH